MVAIDMTQAKAPARKSASRRTTKVETAAMTERDRRAEGLLGISQLAQGVALMAGQYADAATIGQKSPPMLTELANLSEHYEWIAKPVDFLIQVGPFGTFLAAFLPFGLQIAANHGWIDANKAAGQGIVPPDVLESQMKAEITRMQAEALRQQQEAIVEAQAMQREYEAMMAEMASPPEDTREPTSVSG